MAATENVCEWPYNVLDSREHALMVERSFKERLCDVHICIICDPLEIERMTGRPPPADNVLIHFDLPLDRSLEFFTTWADILNTG